MKKNILSITALFALSVALMLFMGNASLTNAQDDKKHDFDDDEHEHVVKPLQLAPTDTNSYPNGCVSCHINTGKENEDYRLNNELAKIEHHPKLSAVKVVPDDCKKCHSEGKKIGSIAQVVHKMHFGKGNDSYYIKVYKGLCTNCHNMNDKDWKMKVKSGPINW